jgi:hypothetical protein
LQPIKDEANQFNGGYRYRFGRDASVLASGQPVRQSKNLHAAMNEWYALSVTTS